MTLGKIVVSGMQGADGVGEYSVRIINDNNGAAPQEIWLWGICPNERGRFDVISFDMVGLRRQEIWGKVILTDRTAEEAHRSAHADALNTAAGYQKLMPLKMEDRSGYFAWADLKRAVKRL